MQTVERQGSFYRFRLHPFDPDDSGGRPSNLLLERVLKFGTPASAATFLRHFAVDPFAVRGLQSILERLGPWCSVHGTSDQWIELLAPFLASGRVVVVEQTPRAPAGESTKDAPSPPPMPPPLRRSGPTPPEPDPATFSPSADEEAQAQALIEAAKNGTPFCEECARAAAARNQSNA